MRWFPVESSALEPMASMCSSLALQPQHLQPSVSISHHKAAAAACNGEHGGLVAAVTHVRYVAGVQVNLQRVTRRLGHTSHTAARYLDHASVGTAYKRMAAAKQLQRAREQQRAAACELSCQTCTALICP